MNKRQKEKRGYLLRLGLLLFGLSFIFACGGGGSGDASVTAAGQSGSIAFSLVIQERRALDSPRSAPEIDICQVYAIETINATVLDSSRNPIASGNWPCSDHAAQLDGIPAGYGLSLLVQGVAPGEPLWQGERTDIEVIAGQTTFIGEIALSEVGLVWDEHNWGQANWQ